MIIRKRIDGEVQYNDGDFAEIMTIGIEETEEGLWLDAFQIHKCETENTPEEFQNRFPVGMRLSILTITELTEQNSPKNVAS